MLFEQHGHRQVPDGFKVRKLNHPMTTSEATAASDAASDDGATSGDMVAMWHDYVYERKCRF
jgi:hypothetical protein